MAICAQRRRTVMDQFDSCPEEIRAYLSDLPRLLDSFPLDVSISYACDGCQSRRWLFQLHHTHTHTTTTTTATWATPNRPPATLRWWPITPI